MKLSPAKVAEFKPTSQKYKVSDDGGLYNVKLRSCIIVYQQDLKSIFTFGNFTGLFCSLLGFRDLEGQTYIHIGTLASLTMVPVSTTLSA